MMSSKMRSMLFTIAVVIVLLTVTVLMIYIFKIRRDNSKNLYDLFGDSFGITEFRQISDVYDLTSLQDFRMYNPSVFTLENGNDPYYLYRLCNYTLCPGSAVNIFDMKARDKILTHTLIENPTGELFIVRHPPVSREGCERGCQDSRGFVHNGSLHLICNSASGENCRREMVMMEFNLEELQLGIEDHETLEGATGKRTYIRELKPHSLTKLSVDFEADQDQKNWMPFIDTDLYFVYSINPHIIVKFLGPRGYSEYYDPLKNGGATCKTIANTTNDRVPKNLRGGGQIIKVLKNSKDLYLGIVHTRDSTLQYSTYFYAFETKHPYRVTHLTHGFVFGERGTHSKRIQFASGLARIVGNDNIPYLYVTYGEDDCTGKLCILKEIDVITALIDV